MLLHAFAGSGARLCSSAAHTQAAAAAHRLLATSAAAAAGASRTPGEAGHDAATSLSGAERGAARSSDCVEGGCAAAACVCGRAPRQ
jgi:hypothetical protein